MSHGNFTVRFSAGREIAAVEARSGRSFARHSHDEFGIGVVTQGAHRSWSGRGTVEAVLRASLRRFPPAKIRASADLLEQLSAALADSI